MIVRVVFTGRSYQTGAQLPGEVSVPDGSQVGELLEQLEAELPENQRLPRSCLVAVSGKHLGTVQQHQPHVLRDGDELLLIAPVAGG